MAQLGLSAARKKAKKAADLRQTARLERENAPKRLAALGNRAIGEQDVKSTEQRMGRSTLPFDVGKDRPFFFAATGKSLQPAGFAEGLSKARGKGGSVQVGGTKRTPGGVTLTDRELRARQKRRSRRGSTILTRFGQEERGGSILSRRDSPGRIGGGRERGGRGF